MSGIASPKLPSVNACPDAGLVEDAAKPVRAFVALSLPPQVLDHVGQVQRRLRQDPAARPVRWSRPDQVHLTLKFVGNVPGDELERLRAALSAVCTGQPSLELALTGLGCFPHTRHPRVVWIGLGGDLGRLADLQRRIEDALRGFGDHVEERRPFHPHLTLGRVNAHGEEGRKLADLLARERVPPLEAWTVHRVDLIRSELRPQGAHHTLLHSAELSGGRVARERAGGSWLVKAAGGD
jgi:2'-5' RNA ligase